MNCKTIQQKLFFLAEKELPTQEAAIVENHLEGCSECKMIYEELQNVLNVIAIEKQFSVNPFFATRVLQKLENLQEKETLQRQLSRIPAYVRLMPVAISFVLAVWLSLNLSVSFSQDKDQGSVSQQTDSTSYYEEIIPQDLIAGTLESVLMLNGDKN